MKRKNAFTLIELLVVISIIALLLAIIMPSLKKAKLAAQTVICVANCRSLSTAWNTYAADNDGKIVSSSTGYGRFGEHLSNGNENPNAWVDWAGIPNYDDPQDVKDQIETVRRGKLFPYLNTIDIYRCPLSKKEEVRCYVIPDYLGGNKKLENHSTMKGLEIVTRMSQLKRPSERINFLDEDKISYGGFTIWYS